MLRTILGVLLGLFFAVGNVKAIAEPLPAEQAFKFSVNLDHKQVVLNWEIAPDYYLYRDKLNIIPGPGNRTHVGEIVLPHGINKKDNIRGPYQIYRDAVQVKIPLLQLKPGIIDLIIRYQGCSAQGFCYSPITKSLVVDLATIPLSQDLTAYLSYMPSVHAHTPSEQENIQSIFVKHNMPMVVLSFLGLGLLLAFTPCVLPMIPILSGIIMGQRRNKLGLGKAFLLSLAYVWGMAITYALAGMVVALVGNRVQTEFQRPWVIVLFSVIFILLALSLFDIYQLRLPLRLQQRLTQWSHRQKGGTYLGVFFMGSISSLVVSPCITPPLVGVLAYIAQTGDSLLGAMALLALGLGMGIPLLLIGISAGKLLPKAGPWMIVLERSMGWLMLAFAVWMLSRVVSGPVTLFLCSLWLMAFAIVVGAFTSKTFLLRKGLSIVLFIYALIMMIGAFQGNNNPFKPWENWRSHTLKESVKFLTLTSMQQLNDQLLLAKQQQKPVIIDFYADWCESCIRMERYVLSRPDVQRVLADFVLLRADVTANNVFDQNVMKRFDVIAPPSFVFFDKIGGRLITQQLVGEVDAATFLQYLLRVEEKGVNNGS